LLIRHLNTVPYCQKYTSTDCCIFGDFAYRVSVKLKVWFLFVYRSVFYQESTKSWSRVPICCWHCVCDWCFWKHSRRIFSPTSIRQICYFEVEYYYY